MTPPQAFRFVMHGPGTRGRKRRNPPGSGRKVLGLIVLAGAWGLVKNFLMGQDSRTRVLARHGPIAAFALEGQAASFLAPGGLLSSVVTGPLAEELLYRRAVQPHLGIGTTAALFGLGHYDDELAPARRFEKVLDAALGGMVYGSAFQLGGIPASWAAHAAHNLGASLGVAAGLAGR